ncbi:SH3 domain-containing protein 19 isoform X2 [Ochlerotatus camptorhynchus]|uniref:SH3 domain-containing protein 19 isoform X2 n=1 Tax=Ochlerotatus camptorhynchus TaxID=644619 RepID=UPI0031D6C64A
MSRNMTIPSRPAPPPPQAASNKTTRYSPATNWDDTPFSAPPTSIGAVGSRPAPPLTGNQLNMKPKKAPPPRPPPPKVVPALKKPGQPQSINILSNLFGQKRNHASKGVAQKGQVPMKLPPPPKQPPPLHQHTTGHYSSIGSTPNSNAQSHGNGAEFLISFDSPPSSPTFTQKSCSDCISVDSFSSDSNYSSPNNGNMSQAESGFEDDFVSQHEHQRSKATTPASSTAATPSSSTLKDLWDLSDTFGMPPPGAKSTTSTSTSNIYAPLSSATIRAPAVNSKLYASEFVDPLCNGKSVAPKVQTVAKPTIIKPGGCNGSNSQKSTPVHNLKPKSAMPGLWATMKSPAPLPTTIVPVAARLPPMVDGFDDGEESLDSLPSPPMPNIPPPPPPPCVADESEDLETTEPYGIAMYDFRGETDEDLSFRINEKIYLLKRLNEEWLLGRDRRGCEGMFPANYIEVKVSLQEGRLPTTTTSNSKSSNQSATKYGDISHSGTDSFKNHLKVRVLYTFNAETPEDLTIVENEHVTVLGQITSEWLYGEMNGRRGQFPANFIEYLPPNLPSMAASGGT